MQRELLIKVDFIIMALAVMLVGSKVMGLLVVLSLVATFELAMEDSMQEVGSMVKDFMVESIAVEPELELVQELVLVLVLELG